MNKLLILKIGGYLLSAAGTIVAGWVGKRENEKILKKLVEEQLKKH